MNIWRLPSELLVAIQYNNIDRCKELLEAGANCDQIFRINSQNRPAICLGVERGAIQLGEDKRFSIFSGGTWKNNDLSAGCLLRCFPVDLFIRSGSAINLRDSDGK